MASKLKRQADIVSRAVWARGIFPHQLAWLLNNPLRRLIITPQQLADRLPLQDDSSVLEIGPGSGYFSAELAARTRRGALHLIDAQPEMLMKARARLRSRGFTHIVYSAGDAGSGLPIKPGTIDLAVLVSVLGEVRDMNQCLTLLYNVLRPGGIVAIHESVPDPDLVPQPQLISLAERSGFVAERFIGRRWNYTALLRRPFGP